MQEFTQAILSGLATFVLAVFLPKHITVFLREFIVFVFGSLLRYWWLVVDVSALLMSILLISRADRMFPLRMISPAETAWIVLVACLFTVVIAGRQILSKRYPPINIAVYGCYSVKEGSYLTTDIESTVLSQHLEKTINATQSTMFTYRKHLIKIHNITLPKFLPMMLGYSGLDKLIGKRVASGNHLAALYFIRDIGKLHVSPVLHFNTEQLRNTDPFKQVERLLHDLATDSQLNAIRVVKFSIKVYLLLFAQSVIEMLLDLKKYPEGHNVLSDTEKLISEIRQETADFPDARKKSIEDFLNFWQASVDRFSAIMLFEQQEYSGAVKHAFKSIRLNPYFPYATYDSLRQDITKRYALQLMKQPLMDATQLAPTREEINRQVDFADLDLTYAILHDILRKNPSPEIHALISQELTTLDERDPFILFLKSDVIRYIPKGKEKFNEVYVDRLDECIRLLSMLLKIEKDFPLIHTKLGMLLTMKGLHTDNNSLINEGMREYLEGEHFMKKLGLL